jgi:hypothetical protein
MDTSKPTFERYGPHHMRVIGKTGARITMERHGVAYFQGIVTAKRWNGRRKPSFQHDLFGGKVFAGYAV